MPNKIKPKRSYTANSVPLTTDLETNELAINWADGKAYTKNASGQIVTVALGGSSGGGSSSLVTAATVAGFPATGSAANIYIATDTNRIYRWDAANSIYVELGPLASSGDTLLRSYLVPTAPSNVVATAGNAQVSLTWTASSSLSQIPVTDYLIQSSTDNGTTWTLASDTVSTATSATISGLQNGQSYRFRVAAVNGAGVGSYSAASSAVTPDNIVSIQYLVIAGGGGGGRYYSGGGGAGGYRSGQFTALPGQSQTVTVGAGGAALTSSGDGIGTSGSNSAFSTVTSIGGGFGAGSSTSATTGGSGGSGGGGGGTGSGGSGGAATSGQGNNGGAGSGTGGGGGGGSSATGANASSSVGGNGGDGTASSITGSSVVRAAGGGGSSSTPGSGGAGGGGSGATDSVAGTSGTANTGSGGGGGSLPQAGGSGGSGVVILRCSSAAASTTGSPTVATVSGDTVYTFTGSGSITF